MPRFSVFILFFLMSSVAFASKVSTQTSSKKLVKPAHLKKGDTIIILAPAGKISDKKSIEGGIKLAEKWGLHVVFGNHLFAINNSFAGTDNQRLNDFQNALDDKSIKAIWCARGGYGTVRIIDQLDFTQFKKNPKWIIGYSDVTVLHNKIHNLGFETIHGQMPKTLDLENKEQKASIKTLKNTLFGKRLSYKIPSHSSNKKGESSGQLIGGNLSILYSMLGSETSLNTKGKILFIEDIGEALYHIDRMLISLKRAGYFDELNGLIVGDFKLKKSEGNKFGKTLQEIVLDVTKDFNFPIVFDFPAGHIDDNRALILGSEIDLKVDEKKTLISFKNE